VKLLRLTLVTALRALRRNKLRSALTILGIVIGVAAVIAMVGVGRGATRRVTDFIGSLGDNLLFVVPGTTTWSGARSGWGGRTNLTRGDAEAILRECPSVRDVTWERREVAQVVYGSENWSTVVRGTTPSYEQVAKVALQSGAFFDERDLRSGARVAVLGTTVVDQVFGPGQDPLGAVVRIKDVPFSVVGVLARKGQSGWGHDQDDVVLVPFTTSERRLSRSPFAGRVETILVSARSQALAATAAEEIEALLRERHRLRDDQDSDFTVRNLQEVAETAQSVMGVMTTVLLAVSSISLLVGGIGIMNILLVSVTERTREIGIRMAVGAKSRHILLQFLVESMVLSVIGGVFGIALGIGATIAVSRFAGWAPLHSPDVVLGAVLFSAAVGVFFGFYPARQASRLDPIAALRFE
jgi:putative ABC transport system permease protein